MFPSFWWTNMPPWGTENQVGIKFWDVLNQNEEILSSLLPFSSHFRLCPTLWRALTRSSGSVQPSWQPPWTPFWLRCDTCLLCAHLREERFWKKGTWTPEGSSAGSSKQEVDFRWAPNEHHTDTIRWSTDSACPLGRRTIRGEPAQLPDLVSVFFSHNPTLAVWWRQVTLLHKDEFLLPDLNMRLVIFGWRTNKCDHFTSDVSYFIRFEHFYLIYSRKFTLHKILPPQFSSVQSLSRVWLFATPWIAAHQASLSITNSRSSLRLTSIESVMPSSHLILCRPLLFLPPIPPSIRVFSNESTLRMRWPKYWSFSFSISPSKEHPGLICSRMDWLDLLAVQGTLKSLLQHHS